MPTKTYYTDAAKTDAVVLSWGWNWKNLHIRHQHQEIGRFTTKKDLQKGGTFPLPGEKKLYIRLSDAMTPELELFVDGAPVPGTAADPHHTLRQLFYMGLILGGFNVAIGIAGELLTHRFLQTLGAGFGSLVFGLALILLAFAIRKGSVLAIIASMLLWALDLVAMYYYALEGDDTPSNGGLLLKIYFIYILYRGIAAARKSKEAPSTAMSS